MTQYEEVQSVINEYIRLMDTLIVFEKEKLDVICHKDIDLLNKYIKEEQVFLLQLRGLDQKRETILAKCGLAGLTYRQIIEKMDGSEKMEMQDSYQVLSIKTNEFKQIIDTIKSHIEVKSHIIDHMIQKLGGDKESLAGTYRVSGDASQSSGISTGRFQSSKI